MSEEPKNQQLVKGPAWWTSRRLPGKRWPVEIVQFLPKLVRVRAVEKIGPAAHPRWGLIPGQTFLTKPEQLTPRGKQLWIQDC